MENSGMPHVGPPGGGMEQTGPMFHSPQGYGSGNQGNVYHGNPGAAQQQGMKVNMVQYGGQQTGGAAMMGVMHQYNPNMMNQQNKMAQQGYTDVTVYNAQMVNAQSGHMTVQGIVGQPGPGGNMMAGQHGAMMVPQQQTGPAMGQQVMMQQQGVMAQGMMAQHGGGTAMMNTGQEMMQQQQGFVGNAAAQNQMMSPTGGMQATGIVVQGGFVPQGNTVMMAQQNVTMVPSHQSQQQIMSAQQQGVAVQHQYMAQNANVAVNVMQIQQQPATGTMQNMQHIHQIQQGTVVQGPQMTAVAFSVPQQSQQIQFPAAAQNHMNTSGAQGVYNNSTAMHFNASQPQQRLQMKSNVRNSAPVSVSYVQSAPGVFTSGAQLHKPNVSAGNIKQTVSDSSQETKTTTCAMTMVSSRQIGVSAAMATTVTATGGLVTSSNNQTNQSGVVLTNSEANQNQPSKSPGEQGASAKHLQQNNQHASVSQPSISTQSIAEGQSQASTVPNCSSNVQSQVQQQKARTNVAQNYPSLAATLNMTSSSIITQLSSCMTSSVVTTQANTTAQCAASMSHSTSVSHEQATQRLRHLPVQNYPNPHHQQQQHVGPHQRPPNPHHRMQSPPGGGGLPHAQMHQRATNPHHMQSPPGGPHHHMQSPPAMSPHHQMQSPHHMPHHSGGPGAVPHMMHHHHQGSPPGVHHPGHHPGMYPGGHHQGMVPFGPHHPHHGSGTGPMHHPGAPPHHPHHLQHPPQHPASINSPQFQQHHPAVGGQAPPPHHSHTPSPHLTPSPHRTPSPGGSLRHQHPTLAQSLGHHPPHHHPPHQGMPHPPHMGPQQQHPGMHGLRSPPPRMPSPHYNQTHPLTHMNQSEIGSEQMRHQMNNPHMCNMHQQPQNIINQSQPHGPHGTVLNPTNSATHRPPSIPNRQRPHASEFMDPNARLKAMEEESDNQSGNSVPTSSGPHQQHFPGEGREDLPGKEAVEADGLTHHTQVVSIAVPLGWKRVVEAGMVVYYSPSAVRLGGFDQLRQYLTTEGTCKCGLECPLLVQKVFNFDPQVASKQWSPSESKMNDDLTKLCNHKRKILAMASFHTSQMSRAVHTPPTGNPNMFHNTELATLEENIPENKVATGPKGPKKRKRKKKNAAQVAVEAALAAIVKSEEGIQSAHDDTVTSSVPAPSGSNVTDPLTVNTQTSSALSDGQTNKDKKPQVSPGTSVFIAEQAKLQRQAGDWQMSEIQRMIKKGSKEESEMNKIAAMLNLGPKNSDLAHGMQNALFGPGGKDGNNKAGPPAEQNHPHPPVVPAGPVGPQAPGAFNQQGPRPPFPPGMPVNISGMNMEGMAGMMEGMFPAGTNPFPPGMFPPWMEAGLKPKKRAKGRRKKKVNSVLDRTPPCPNVDVRLMHPGMVPGMVQGALPTGPPHQQGAGPTNQHMSGNPGNQGMHPSFLENPTHFLAQQAAFVNNSLNTSSQQHDADGAPNDGLSSTHSSPIARLAPGRSPPAVGRSPPRSSPAPLSLPSPASQSTPTQMTPPRSRRSSVSSHSNTVSPCVTPQGSMMSPPAALVAESPCSANDSSSSTATAPSCGSSFSQSPTTSCVPSLTPSPSSGQKVNSRLNMSPVSPRGPLPPGMDTKQIVEQELQKLAKSSKGSKLKGAAQNKGKLNQNQMNLSFSNALEFQQLLANKYGTGNFPASSLLTAAAKAQGNPLTQAITQLQQGLTKKPKGKGRKGKAGASNNRNQSAAAGNAKADDFHASSFLMNEGGQVEGGEALMAALLGNPNLTNSNQAQMLLQQMSNVNGQNNDSEGVRMDPEQLAASQMAMLNMAASLMTGNNHANPGVSGKDNAGFGAHNTVMTGLDVAHNAIINAFNASNMETAAKRPRAKRRRSAPQGDPSMLGTPTKCARPNSAPGGNFMPQQLFQDMTSSSELKNSSQAASSPRKANLPTNEQTVDGMPPMSVSGVTGTNCDTQVVSSACVAQPSTSVNTVTVPQLQNSVTPEQLSQLQLGVLNPQLSNAQLAELQQQLINQQQQLFQGQNQMLQGNDLQQQIGMLQAMNPGLLQQQLAQFQQTGGLGMDMLTQLQLSQLAMAGQLPDQALASVVQGGAMQTATDKDLQPVHTGDAAKSAEVGVGSKERSNSDNTKPAENSASPEKSPTEKSTTSPRARTPGRSPRRPASASHGNVGEEGKEANSPENAARDGAETIAHETPTAPKKTPARGRGRKKDKSKKSSTPTIARMLQAQQSNSEVNMAGLQGMDPSVLLQQSAMMQNPLLANNPAALAMMAQQASYLSPEALAMQSAQLQNQMLMLQANMLTGGILGSGIQASLQDVVLQSHLMANMQTGQPEAGNQANQPTAAEGATGTNPVETAEGETSETTPTTSATTTTSTAEAGKVPVQQPGTSSAATTAATATAMAQQAVQDGADPNVVQAMLQSGMLGAGGGNLDAQTIAALAVGGVAPNALGMVGLQPDVMGVQGMQSTVAGLPAGISPMAMLQALQLQQQMLKALNPALNFDMTNEQIMQMMNQSGFGMVSMPTADAQQQQQQQLQLQTQEKQDTSPSKQQTGETKSNETTPTKSQGKKRAHHPHAAGEQDSATTSATNRAGAEKREAQTVAEAGKEQRNKGKQKKGKKNSVDMIYEAVVDAAKCGTSVVITEDQESADKTMEALPEDAATPTEKNSAETAAGDVVPPLRIVVGAKRALNRAPGRPKKKRRKMTPRKIVINSGGGSGGGENSLSGNEDSNGVFDSEIPDADNLTEAVSAVVRQEKLSVFGEYLEGNEVISAGGFKPQATSSQSTYPEGQEAEEDEEEEGEAEEEDQEEGLSGPEVEPEDLPEVLEGSTGPDDTEPSTESKSCTPAAATALVHDESGVEMGDSSLENRSPSGCTPDTDHGADGPNHDSDSGIGRDGGGLSEQESMDKSHNSDTPNIFENPLSDGQSTGSDTQTPESETRELTMEDMSCQTGEDLLEHPNIEVETEDQPAKQEPVANHVPQSTNQETVNEDIQPEVNHVTGDQPISKEGPESLVLPRSGVTNEVGVSENPDVLDEQEVDVANNNNEVVDGHEDSEATEEDDCSENEDVPTPTYPRNFNVGDVVWGKIRGFESWPGKLVHESEVKLHHNSKHTDIKSSDHLLWVRWYGGHTFTQEEPETLKTLSEGLEAHHRNTRNHRRGRKLNLNLESAIQEAMNELDRQAAPPLGTNSDDLDGATKVPNRITVNTKRRKTKA